MAALTVADSDDILDDPLIPGPAIDADLGITDRCRRKMVKDKRLPEPDGYIGGRAVWRRSRYLAARERLLAAGRPRRPGLGAPIAA
jgi:hypothetical protein